VKAEGVNDVWCVDLVFDVTQRGTTVKFLTIIDEGSHYCIDIVASRRGGGIAGGQQPARRAPPSAQR
jgi:hypothetical protein